MRAARSLPTGTVSLLFTDIEGSTRLLEALGDRYADALAEHRRLLRAAFGEHQGSEVDTQGDAFFYAFPRAQDAVAGAVAGQQALAAHAWPMDVPLRVRMGIHTGEPTATREGFVGIDVHRAARVMSAGHGGQILLTQSTTDLVAEKLPDAVSVRDLGEHRLADLAHAQRLYQVVMPGLEVDFPPLKTLEARPTNLPTQLTAFVGRAREVTETMTLVRRGDVRLVTVTGAGGTGKTRLALQVAAELIDEFADGVFFADLASITDPDLLVPTIAQTLSLRERPGRPLSETLHDYLRDKHLLLVLDNFEQLLDAGPVVTDLLARAAKVQALVTSRAPLHLSGEHEYPVPPLAVPQLDAAESPGRYMAYEAVQLFLDRAQAVKPDFELTSENAQAVAEICARLDGLPLAIELGAARVRMQSPQALLGRLSRRLALLTGGARDAPARQRTLRDTIDWSHGLLNASEQRLFARLSVFVGGCTIEGAEAVCDPAAELDVVLFDGIASLVEKSLLRQGEGPAGEPRFSMLETIREYALERLAGEGEGEAVRQRHADYFTVLAEEAEPEILGADQLAWLERLEADRDNFRAALGWLLDRGHSDRALRLIGSLRRAWVARGYLSETRTWLELAFEQRSGVPPQVEAKARYGLGRVALVQGDYDHAIPALEESARLFREAGETEGLVFSLADLGFLATAQGRHDDAQRFAEESLAVANAGGNESSIAAALHSLACTKLDADEYAEARALFEESLTLRRTLGDKRNTANSLCYLGSVALLEGDHDRATAVLDESLALGRELGNQLIVAAALANECLVAVAAGDTERAAAVLCAESLALSHELGDKRTVVECLHGLAGVAALQAEPLRAALLAGAAESLHAAIKAPPSPAERTVGERLLSLARSAVDDQSFEAAWERGRQLSYDAAIAYALEKPDVLAPRV